MRKYRAVISVAVLAIVVSGIVPATPADAASPKIMVRGTMVGLVQSCRDVITYADQYAPNQGTYSIQSVGVIPTNGHAKLKVTVDLRRRMPGAVYTFRIQQNYGSQRFVYCKTYPLGFRQAKVDKSGHAHYEVTFGWDVLPFASNGGVQILACPVGPGINPNCQGLGAYLSMPKLVVVN